MTELDLQGRTSQRCRQGPDFEVVVPAINEERRIGATVTALSEYLAAQPWSAKVIVVDNGSADATAEVVDRARGHVPLEIIGCRQRGKGAAVRAGVFHSSARWVGYCDADLATPPAAIGEAVALLTSGWDVVVGSRRCAGASYVVAQPSLRRCGGEIFHAVARRFTPAISDTQCGFKVFDGDVARTLFASTRLHGFAFDVEILSRALRDDLRVVELPVAWTDQAGSTFRPLVDGIRTVRELWTAHRDLIASEASW